MPNLRTVDGAVSRLYLPGSPPPLPPAEPSEQGKLSALVDYGRKEIRYYETLQINDITVYEFYSSGGKFSSDSFAVANYQNEVQVAGRFFGDDSVGMLIATQRFNKGDEIVITGESIASVEHALTGYVLGKSTVGINDALEILKYLADMDNVITKSGEDSQAWSSALITPASQRTGKPRVNDAIEILKKIAKMKSLVG